MLKMGESLDSNAISDERWRAVEEIASSSTFRRSPRLKELLLFIAKHSLAGNDEQLTESEIARQVFGRGSDYVATEDSIVRSSARQLRWKLKEFGETNELRAAWAIDIPKGRYVAHFQLRGDPLPTQAPKNPRNRWKTITAALAGVLVLSSAANVWFLDRALPPAGKFGLVASLVMARPDETNVVMDDYAYVLMAPRPYPPNEALLDNYTSRSYIPRSSAPSQNPEYLRLWDLLGTRYIVSWGATVTADRILRSLPKQDRVVLRHSRNLVARDFQRGNYILFGSAPNNPWTMLFEDRLNFRFSRQNTGAATFVNREPASGEEQVYKIKQNSSVNSGPGYARIVYLPNLSHSGFVLMVTGLNMVTAEAAGEFSTSPADLPVLLKRLGAPDVAQLPYFEMLLRTSAVDNMPKNISVVAARRINNK
jgi:hypothetical protein